MLRHQYACDALRAGLSLLDVQILLGHSDLRTTSIYLHVRPDDLAARVRRLLAPSPQVSLSL
jgi:site-specific recombinase XerD